MSVRRAVLIMVISAALTTGVAALLMNIAERKREGRHLEECPCASAACPHPKPVVE